MRQKRAWWRALAELGFKVVREREHISLERQSQDGTRTMMTLPNHRMIKGVDPAIHLHSSRHFTSRLHRGVRPNVAIGHEVVTIVSSRRGPVEMMAMALSASS